MVTTAVVAETKTVLEDISWQTFKAMLAEMSHHRNTKLAYDNGILEIMGNGMLKIENIACEPLERRFEMA